MSFVFKRRVGAAADVAELEYCIALHQTAPETRKNATVSSRDVQRLLTSRYGLSLTHGQAIELVRSLSGGGTTVQEISRPRHWKLKARRPNISDDARGNQHVNGSSQQTSTGIEDPSSSGAARHPDSCVDLPDTSRTDGHRSAPDSHPKDEQLPEEYLDLVQMLAVLLMPTMARIADEFRNGPHPEPYLDETVIQRRFLKCFQPFARLYDSFRSWWADRRYSQYNRLRPKPHDVLPHAISHFWAAKLGRTANEEPPVIDEDAVTCLLIKYNELQRASNPRLVQEMVKIARSPSGRLDSEAVVNAISSDLRDWVVGSEDLLSTHFEDVFGTSSPTLVTQIRDEPAVSHDPNAVDVEACSPAAVTYPIDKKVAGIVSRAFSWLWFVLTLGEVFGYCSSTITQAFAVEPANVDNVVDAHSSILASVLIWMFALTTITVYVSSLVAIPPLPCTAESYGCLILDKIFAWAVLAMVFCLLGIIIIVPLTFGNNPFKKSRFRPTVSALVAVIYAAIPYVVYEAIRKIQTMNDSGADTQVSDPYEAVRGVAFNLGQFICLVTGLLLPVIYLLVALSLSFQSTKYYSYEAMGILRWALSSSNRRAEMRVKWAATSKVNSMLVNSCRLHFIRSAGEDIAWLDRTFEELASTRLTDHATENFLLCGEQLQLAGGFVWTWKRILNGKLFDEEGIWLNSHLIQLQAGQAIFCAASSILLYQFVAVAAARAQTAIDDLPDGLPQWYLDLIPTKAMVEWALYPAWAIAFAVMILLILLYIPSSVTTILKYRCQIHPSLGSPYFQRFRVAVDCIYMNAANAVWAMLGSSLLFFLLFGALLFLFLWPPTSAFMKTLLAWCIGLTATMVLKMLLTMYCRKRSYRFFYRVEPQVAEVTSLALEFWYIALGGAVVLGRILQYLFAAVFWVGRCDMPFLHPDVSLFGYSFDYVPTHFTKELLVHEAHRHPYIERLAQMYLMKLRHETFVSDAGAAWRQLAILALFPWLSKHRVFDNEKFEQAKKALVDARLAQAQQQQRPGLIGMVAGAVTEIAAMPVPTLELNALSTWAKPKTEAFRDEVGPEEFSDAVETSNP